MPVDEGNRPAPPDRTISRDVIQGLDVRGVVLREMQAGVPRSFAEDLLGAVVRDVFVSLRSKGIMMSLDDAREVFQRFKEVVDDDNIGLGNAQAMACELLAEGDIEAPRYIKEQMTQVVIGEICNPRSVRDGNVYLAMDDVREVVLKKLRELKGIHERLVTSIDVRAGIVGDELRGGLRSLFSVASLFDNDILRYNARAACRAQPPDQKAFVARTVSEFGPLIEHHRDYFMRKLFLGRSATVEAIAQGIFERAQFEQAKGGAHARVR